MIQMGVAAVSPLARAAGWGGGLSRIRCDRPSGGGPRRLWRFTRGPARQSPCTSYMWPLWGRWGRFPVWRNLHPMVGAAPPTLAGTRCPLWCHFGVFSFCDESPARLSLDRRFLLRAFNFAFSVGAIYHAGAWISRVLSARRSYGAVGALS